MNIKSLLIGSAATMVAVSSAQAADAIVVEPEPVEYVRVCDAYGTGFFFIPGTETCIRFSGFIRSAYDKTYFDGDVLTAVDNNGTQADTTDDIGTVVEVDSDAVFWGHRARINIDTRNETEWGTLRAIARLETDSNVKGGVNMDVALISLAGFRAGFAGGNYWTTNHGWGGVNAEGVGGSLTGVASDAYGFYGFDDATIFDYTFAAEGFSVTVGVEDPRIKYGTGDPANGTFNGDSGGYANFYAGFNYSGDWGGLAFTAVHDSLASDMASEGTLLAVGASGRDSDLGEWAYKVSVNLDLSEFVPGGALWGWYMDDGDAVTNYVHAGGMLANPESVWGVAFQANLTDEVEFWANYWNAEGGNAALSYTDGTGIIVEEDGASQWGVGLNWYPSAAPGFHIKTAYYSGKVEDSLGGISGDLYVAGAQASNIDYDGFEIVLRRDF